MAGIIKAEGRTLVMPEDFIDKITDLRVTKESFQGSIIDVGMYAADILVKMCQKIGQLYNGRRFSAHFDPFCGSAGQDCRPFIAVHSARSFSIGSKHQIPDYDYARWGTGHTPQPSPCVKDYKYMFFISIYPRKPIFHRVRTEMSISFAYDNKPYNYHNNYTKFNSFLSFIRFLEHNMGSYGSHIGDLTTVCFNDFCSIPERFNRILEPMYKRHEETIESVKRMHKGLQSLEAGLDSLALDPLEEKFRLLEARQR